MLILLLKKKWLTNGKALVHRLEIRALKESKNWCDIMGGWGVYIFFCEGGSLNE